MATSVHLGYPGAVGGAAVGAARSPTQASRVRRHDETDFMQSLFDALTKCGILVWRNNTGVAKWDNGARTRYGIGKGGADLVGCVGGAFFGIETKAVTVTRNGPSSGAAPRISVCAAHASLLS